MLPSVDITAVGKKNLKRQWFLSSKPLQTFQNSNIKILAGWWTAEAPKNKGNPPKSWIVTSPDDGVFWLLSGNLGNEPNLTNDKLSICSTSIWNFPKVTVIIACFISYFTQHFRPPKNGGRYSPSMKLLTIPGMIQAHEQYSKIFPRSTGTSIWCSSSVPSSTGRSFLTMKTGRSRGKLWFFFGSKKPQI